MPTDPLDERIQKTIDGITAEVNLGKCCEVEYVEGHADSDDFDIAEDKLYFYLRIPLSIISVWHSKRSRIEAMEEKWNAWILVKPLAQLVPAKVGDYVRPFKDSAISADDLPLGIVTSKKKLSDGRIKYGCRYILPVDTFEKQNIGGVPGVFYLTNEDYGGYHDGFCSVISERVAINVLKKQCLAAIENIHQKALEGIKNIDGGLPGTIKQLTKYKVESTELVDTQWLAPKEAIND